MCIDSTQFVCKDVDTECTLGEFCKMHCLDPFLFMELKESIQVPNMYFHELDVILMDQVSSYRCAPKTAIIANCNYIGW